MAERYVLLGLALARAEWFRTIGKWSTSAMLPAEFLRCVSIDELRARLRSGRPFSAVVVDGSLPGVDRDLIALAAEASVSVLVVDDHERRDWRGLGAAAVMASQFSRDELLEVLAANSTPVGSAIYDAAPADAQASEHQGRVIAVTGPGGTGASTIAIALAQGLAAGEGERDDGRKPGRRSTAARRPTVLLADLCRTADQAMLHDSRVVVPSIQEVVEAHRTATPPRSTLLDQTFEVPARGYRLLLGLRRPRHWVALRPRALESALDSLQRLVDVLVADVEPDLEGEAETGSADVEERNLLSRATIARADLVVVVGEPTMKGMFALVRTINELVGFGVRADRLLPVVNRAPRGPRARAELTRSVSELVIASLGSLATGLVSPLYVSDRAVDDALRDGVALPAGMARTIARGVAAVGNRASPAPAAAALGPQPITPGSLSAFTVQEYPNP
jgi:MinD-like ATPase involved in chromosome partitioning or flagellar assembly